MTHLGVWTLSFQPAKVAPPSKVISSDIAPSAKMCSELKTFEHIHPRPNFCLKICLWVTLCSDIIKPPIYFHFIFIYDEQIKQEASQTYQINVHEREASKQVTLHFILRTKLLIIRTKTEQGFAGFPRTTFRLLHLGGFIIFTCCLASPQLAACMRNHLPRAASIIKQDGAINELG